MIICTRLLLFVLGCPETKSDPNFLTSAPSPGKQTDTIYLRLFSRCSRILIDSLRAALQRESIHTHKIISFSNRACEFFTS